MATDAGVPPPKPAAKKAPAAEDRKERLARALRENLRKRKDQDRARDAGEKD